MSFSSLRSTDLLKKHILTPTGCRSHSASPTPFSTPPSLSVSPCSLSTRLTGVHCDASYVSSPINSSHMLRFCYPREIKRILPLFRPSLRESRQWTVVNATATEEFQPSDQGAALIDGKAIAAQIRTEIADGVSSFLAETGRVPGLGVLLVGSRKDSQTYVRQKKKMCQEVGIYSVGVDLPETASQEEVMAAVQSLNSNPKIDGVLVQLPLPQHIPSAPILRLVSPEKDVDGFHPQNVGLLALSPSPNAPNAPLFVPCTPLGCLELLRRSGVQVRGKRAAVIGRSNVVGLPAALLLQREDATVTVIHRYTQNPAEVCREADIVIAAAGVAGLVTADWVKPGAVVIDVGINAVQDDSNPRGYRLVGDVDFGPVSKVASLITPVPGGVGPMTIAMLLQNTLTSAKRSHGLA